MGRVFIHSSIKTRIETRKSMVFESSYFLFLYIVPLKQGLKHLEQVVTDNYGQSFYT